jgi:LmeA-like phospholipid-binding
VSGHAEPRPRRRHRLRAALIVIVVLLGLLVAANFAARAYAENRVAAELQSNGFPRKPDVSIKGFPFLTQLAARDFPDVQISSSDVPEGAVTIQTINATLNAVHLNSSYNGGSVGQLTGTALITFPDLAKALAAKAGLLAAVAAAGVTLSAAGPEEVKATVNLAIANGTATWRIARAGGSQLSAVLVSSSGLPSALLSSVSDITLPLPSLPFGLRLRSIRVSPEGITGRLSGRDISFGS